MLNKINIKNYAAGTCLLLLSLTANSQTIAEIAERQRAKNAIGPSVVNTNNAEVPKTVKPVANSAKPKVHQTRFIASFVNDGEDHALLSHQGNLLRVKAGTRISSELLVKSLKPGTLQIEYVCKQKRCKSKTLSIGQGL